MDKPDFSDCEAKLARACKHIAELDALVTSFLNTDFYRVRSELNQRDGRINIIFDSFHQPDKIINTILGDAIGNLRSALDYAAVALVKPITGNAESIGFPFAGDPNGYTGEVRKGKLGACDAHIQDFFINEVQAYKGGKSESLWVLNNLRNIDKHRFLIATAEIAGVTMSWRDKAGNRYTDCGMDIVAGQSGAFINAPMNYIEITDKPSFTFEVRIKEPPYIPEAALLPFLNCLTSDVERFLNALKISI